MATTSETGSSLADRLMARSARTSRIGSRESIFERFGMQSPYAGGAVSDPSDQAGMFSYLSSKAYFDELRGLSQRRGRLLYRISGMRQKIRVGEAIRTSIATESTRAAMLDRYDPTFIDWSTQLDLEELGIEQPADAVAVAAARRMPRRKRPTAAERALRARIAEASDTLEHLQSLARTAVGSARKAIAERRARSVSALPPSRQPAAARRLSRNLRGTQAAAARGTALNARATEAGSVGSRPLAVASARDSFFAPKGLRRVTEDSPIIMTLEQPESPAPDAEVEQTVQTASRRPAIRPRAHRRVPVATVAREARNQADVGRAGPPAESRTPRRADPLALSRPTERIARSMRLEQATPLTDTRRGLEAAFRTSAQPEQASTALERRIAVRAEAALPDASGRVLNATGYVDADRRAGRRLTQTAEGRLTPAPRTAALVESAPMMAPIQHDAPVADAEGAEPSAEAPQRASRPVTREPQRARVHRTPTSGTRASDAVRTPTSGTRASDAVRTPTSGTRASDAVRTPTSRTRASEAFRTSTARRERVRARQASPTVRRALPPLARAIHRSELQAAEPTSRVAISRPPVDARAFAPGVDRRQVGLSRQLAAAVARESAERHAVTRTERASLTAPGLVLASPAPADASTESVESAESAPTGSSAVQTRTRPSRRSTGRTPTERIAERAEKADAPVHLRTTPDAVDAPENGRRVAVPQRSAVGAPTTESAQRALATSEPSRRSRALPTVRAASRALAQERLGARGRLLSPSSTAHVDVTEPARALASAPIARGTSRRPTDTRLDGTSLVYARSAEVPPTEAADEVAPPVATRRAVGSVEHFRASRGSEATQGSAPRSDAPTRLGPVARATERASTERSGPMGELLAPRAVARFVDGAPDAGSAPAPRVASLAQDPTPLTLARPEPVSEPLDQAAPAPTPSRALASPTPSRAGLASRAADRVERSQTARRSVLPAPTPEVARARAEASERAPTGATQPVRTESGRVVPSRTLRTEASPTERSMAWRTPRSYHARTVAFRTDSGVTEVSQAFRTERQRATASDAYRTPERRAARLAEIAPALTSLTDTQVPVGIEEIDPEGAVVRASRRMDVRRDAVSDSALRSLSEPAMALAAPAPAVDVEGAPEVARGRQTRRAIGRSAVRRDAGSVVPHPIGSDATDRAVTRMLAGPERVYAAPEDVVLDDAVAVPGESLRTPAAQRLARAADRMGTDAGRALRPTSHLADGMTLAAPPAEEVEAPAESIAGGRRSVSPRPGAPSRSRLQQAMRAATTAAASRASDTVLTLAAPQRQLASTASADPTHAPRSTRSGRPRYQVRLSVDETGRVLRASAVDSETGDRVALPASAIDARVEAPKMTPALPEAPGATEWAESRDQRATEAVARSRGADRRARTMLDERGTYVQRAPTTTSDTDVAGAPFIPTPERVGMGADSLRFAGLERTLDVLAGPDDTSLGARLSTDGRPMLRRRAWQRRSAAAELGTIAPVFADAEYSDAPDVPSDSPSWARRAVTGTSAENRGEDPASQRDGQDDWSPTSLMGALVRAERAEDLVQVILERGREVASLREALPKEAIQMVETISGLGADDVALLRSRARVIRPGQLPGTSGSSRTRASRSRKGSPELNQLSAAKAGVGANKITKLADKLMNLIHLAEHARTEARSSVRMAEDSNEARAEGGARVPGMSVEDGDMNLDALYKSVLDSTMEYFEELDSRREDPDGRNKWW
jgi:hypothetical protein